MKDYFSWKDFVKDLEEFYEAERNRDIQRAKEFRESEKAEERRKKETLELKHVHQRVDALKGLYPMTKDMLLERIEMMPNGLFNETIYGWTYPTKPMTQLFAEEYLNGNDLEKIYEYYLTEVKPYIRDK